MLKTHTFNYKGKFNCFSNEFKMPFSLDGRSWDSVDHYMDAKKFETTQWEWIAKKASVDELKMMLVDSTFAIRKDWPELVDILNAELR